MVLSWNEREERIADDDGDTGDAVFLLAESTKTAYHEKLNCTGLSRRDAPPIDELTRGEAQADIRPPCRVCVLSTNDDDVTYAQPENRYADLIAADRERRRREREKWPSPSARRTD